MKKFLYIILSAFLIGTLASCKRIADQNGDLLNDLDANQGGLIGARFLYQEYNSVDTIAEYHYAGTKLAEVVGKRFKTKIIYNGDQINKIIYNGVIGTDSLSYTQFFNYAATDNTKLMNITEIRSVFPNIDATVPSPEEKFKAIHEITLLNGKLRKVFTKRGKENPPATFEFTSYEETLYTYDNNGAKNVEKVEKNYGGLVANVPTAPTSQRMYTFSNYDDKISPYTLLPFGYSLHKSIENVLANRWFSMNNTKKIGVSTNIMPIPTYNETTYTYDLQDYALSGFGIMYDYRPF